MRKKLLLAGYCRELKKDNFEQNSKEKFIVVHLNHPDIILMTICK